LNVRENNVILQSIRCLCHLILDVMEEKVGTMAGQIWRALEGKGGLTQKEIKKEAKLKTDKDFYLALGWLLRENKVMVQDDGKELSIKLL